MSAFRFKRGTAWCGARTLVGGYMPAVDVCRARVVEGEKLCPRHLKARNPARYAELRNPAAEVPGDVATFLVQTRRAPSYLAQVVTMECAPVAKLYTMYDRDGNPIKVSVPE